MGGSLGRTVLLWGLTMEQSFAAPQRRPVSGRSHRPGQSSHGLADASSDVASLLNLEVDPLSPHALGFEPRDAEDGDVFAFGAVHAAVQHAKSVAAGNVTAVAVALDAFSSKHGLTLGISQQEARLLQKTVSKALLQLAGPEARPSKEGLSILVLGAQLGARSLWAASAIVDAAAPDAAEEGLQSASSFRGSAEGNTSSSLSSSAPATVAEFVHHIVSVEDDAQMSTGNAELLRYAFDGAAHADIVQHLPLMPGDDTILHEVLETLIEGYEFKQFDVVVLGPERPAEQLETMVAKNALSPGAIVHACCPAMADPEREKYIKLLKGKFDYDVVDIGSGGGAIVASLQTPRVDVDEL